MHHHQPLAGFPRRQYLLGMQSGLAERLSSPPAWRCFTLTRRKPRERELCRGVRAPLATLGCPRGWLASVDDEGDTRSWLPCCVRPRPVPNQAQSDWRWKRSTAASPIWFTMPRRDWRSCVGWTTRRLACWLTPTASISKSSRGRIRSDARCPQGSCGKCARGTTAAYFPAVV